MSFHVFFSFSTGLSKPLQAPVGTLAAITAHVTEIEETLGLKRTSNGEGPDYSVYWDYDSRPNGRSPAPIEDELLCETVSKHNQWVMRLYEDIETWATKPPSPCETITEADAATIWHGLATLTVPPSRWSRDYYRERMEHLYEVMRGRENEGVTFDTKALTPNQAAAVIRIFDTYLDEWDLRLDVPHGYDHLASSYDGGYDWCSTCGRAMDYTDAIANCRRRKCELKAQAAA